MNPRVLGTVVLLLCLGAGVFSPPLTIADPDDLLAVLSPADATTLAMQTIPGLIYTDQPDSLLDWLNAWEKASGSIEPVMRVRILGAIWDGQFSEYLYDRGIINQLVGYCTKLESSDPRQKVTRDFAIFSRNFADQLLPHVPLGSPEEFFCLLYSGRTEQAWRLLASDDLAATDLRKFRDRELRILDEVLPKFFAVEGGLWSPFGKYAFAGDHALVGLQLGVRKGPWFTRLVMEMRLGRTDRGYLARNEDIMGISDRFDATLVSLEFGRGVPVWGSLSLEPFAGIGIDAVKPLKDEDFLLDALHLDMGAGLHLDFGHHRQWFLAVTGRREWIRPRNSKGTDLWGDAWSVRLALGWNLNNRDQEARRLLEP